MCDSLAVVSPQRTLFAKNSDRDANEAQRLDWRPARDWAPGARLRCTWVEIPQVPRTHAVLLSRPFWTWGAEMGANEHGLAIGNEAVFTRARLPRAGLTGMDLVRLALERAVTADEAVAVISGLLAAHDQGGGCGHERRSFRYSSSFLIADPGGAVVLETSGREWAAERVGAGPCSISNRLTLPSFAAGRESPLFARLANGARRQARTSALAATASAPCDLAAVLRDHGPGGGWPVYRRLSGSLGAPCVHGAGVASSVTVASWISELRADGRHRHWVTATSSPCLSLFKPVAVGEPVPLGSRPTDRDDDSFWWRHERLHRLVMRDPGRLARELVAERDAIESRWWSAPPASPAAFTAHARFVDRCLDRLPAPGAAADLRPAHAQRWWWRRERRSRAQQPETVSPRKD